MFIIRFVLFLFAITALSFTLLMTGKAFDERADWLPDPKEKRVMVSFLTLCWVASIGAIILCTKIA